MNKDIIHSFTRYVGLSDCTHMIGNTTVGRELYRGGGGGEEGGGRT